jgi:hypothetical protein
MWWRAAGGATWSRVIFSLLNRCYAWQPLFVRLTKSQALGVKPMRLLISGGATTVEQMLREDDYDQYLGALVTPRSGNNLNRISSWGVPYAVDNACCFNHARFNADCYVSLLRKVAACPVCPLFVTVPDQVGNHECTAYLFDRWRKRLVRERLLDLPLAFVLQDGCMYSEDVLWDFIEAVFIGGTDDFKEDVLVTCDIIPEAKARGKFVPLGRCNSRSRLRLALRSGCDSVDGSSLSMFPRTWIPKFVRWCKELEQEVKDDDVLLCDLKWRLLGDAGLPLRGLSHPA